MTSHTHPSLPAVRRRVSPTLVAAAAGLTLAGPTTVLGGAEFEAIILDAAPPPGGDILYAAVNGAGQIVYTGDADPEGSVLVYVEVDGADYTWSTLEDPARNFGALDINESGVVAVSWDTGNWGLSRWSPDAGETPIASAGSPFYSDGPAIADDGTVIWAEFHDAFRWNGDGPPELLGRNPDTFCPLWGSNLYISPGGRIANGYGQGFLCVGGRGIASWDDPLSSPTFSGVLGTEGGDRFVHGITDSGKVLVSNVPSVGEMRTYDVETGAFEAVALAMTTWPALWINNDEWIVQADGSLSRDGSSEDLFELVSGGVPKVTQIGAVGENGHFLAFSFIDGDQVAVLIHPSGGTVEGDTNGDGVVNLADLLAILTAWGPCEGCPEDLDGDGQVAFTELLLVLGNWS